MEFWQQCNGINYIFSYRVENLPRKVIFVIQIQFKINVVGKLAQLVQSIALTGRGSLVRVQYFPQKNKMPICTKRVGFFLI